MFGFLKKIFGTAQDRTVRRYFKQVKAVNEWDEKLMSLTDDQLRNKTLEFQKRLADGENIDLLLPEAFAVVKNVCRRLRGTEIHVSGYNQKWDMTPYDVQVVGAIALHNGSIAEMQTGEGKTLTAVMSLYLNALTGKPVHLVTVNDYLAQRDCEWVGTVLRWLGLSTAVITNSTPLEERRELYKSDVVYGTASEFGFDYLRDNSMASSKEEQVQRGYYYAIIDEVDSILIDEARTPLIISGPVPESRQMYDELKTGVAELVKQQRDYCTGLATQAWKVLEAGNFFKEDQPSRKLTEEEKEALRKLWLVSKGIPRHKVLKRVKENPDLRSELDSWDLYYYSDANKEEKADALANLYMVVDEKSSDHELTDKGSRAWQGVSGGHADDFVMLDLGYEYKLIDDDHTLSDEDKVQRKLQIQEEDGKRKERAHNLRQLLRAHLLMEKDVDYIVQEDQIVIIDENTGRPQPGRRFSDGLHQAIEAKENLKVQKETQTYATITLQNYFRMYGKLAGMTGTASTEAFEFKQIYKMDVLAIPTNKPCVRKEHNDEIYMTEREKYNAILAEVKREHEKGRPILLGTESVDVSEKLSRIFRQNKLNHTVLNAKQNDKEAEIVAAAGQTGAITIATNMAGRGTDIKLGEGVAATGGLYVIGSTRHQSRRIDRQLSGRSARQGDPGSSKFFVSFEDHLLRLFASPRLTNILQRFRPPEGEPISASILDKSIATAQKRVEQRNFMMRKHTLEYDDVMNKQRQEIYAYRNEILHSEDIISLSLDVLDTVCAQGAEKFFYDRSSDDGWNPEGYRRWLLGLFPVKFPNSLFEDDHLDVPEIEKISFDIVSKAFEEKVEHESSKFNVNIDEKPAHTAIRNLMIRKLDKYWQEHLLNMDHLRAEVAMRAVGQKDPLLEFKHEAFRLFDELGIRLREDIAHDLFRFEIFSRTQIKFEDLLAQLHLETHRSFLEDIQQGQPPQEEKKNGNSPIEIKIEPFVAEPKSGRNEPCPCQSGKKYKKCCGVELADDDGNKSI